MNVPEATPNSVGTATVQIAFQGAPGCYGQLAGHLFSRLRPDLCNQAQGQAIAYTPCKTFDEVVRAVVDGEVQFGVLPLDNSSVGVNLRAFELLTDRQVAMLADIYLPIQLHLIGLPEADEKMVTKVVSHPMALKQCKRFFVENGKLEPRPYWDTAGACFFIKRQNDPTLAAIAGEAAAQAAGLKILKWNLEDFRENETRYGIITQIPFAMGHVQENFPDTPRLSCSLELDTEKHDLTRFLNAAVAPYEAEVFNVLSFPIPQNPWTYVHILELDLSSSEETQTVWTRIRETALRARILGIYESLRP
ncbi:MAG: prephenate dehydratase domain-containing protein [Candidatus Obscuribacterales bacterium]